ncbi:MFS transporter [archaeon]|jgi:MFS family permease|nr:MFS transporter [archaeon]MBT4352396.1 MFS transporter [archaeon]MBT4647459.1 MFS transporter [archaeon]MBT6822551.1 MFS transporter [archaeon]MBT7392552.1 MFS transporter [archaeon]
MNEDTKSKYKGNIFKINVLYVIAGFTLFFIPIAIFYYQYYGLSYFDIGLTAGIGLLATLLCEIPTGAFADLYGRKKSVSMGLFLYLMGILILTFSSTLFYFIISSIVFGIGQAFLSGAWDALMFDSLKAIKREKEYLKISSRQQSLFLVVLVGSAFLAPYLYTKNIKYPYYVSIFFGVFLFLHSLTLFEILPKKRKFAIIEHIDQMKEGINYVKKHNKIIWIIIFTVISYCIDQIYQQLVGGPYILEKGFIIEQIGIVAFFSIILQTVAMNLSHTIEKKFKEKKAIMISFFGSILFFVLMYFSNKYTFILARGLAGGFIMMSMLILNNALVHKLRKKIRATVISIYSMVMSLFGIIAIAIAGIIIDKTSLQFLIMTMALTGLFFGIILLLIRYQKGIKEKFKF